MNAKQNEASSSLHALIDSRYFPLSIGTNDLYTQDGQFVCVHLPDTNRLQAKKARFLIVVHGYGARKNNSKGRQSVRNLAAYWGKNICSFNWLVIAPHFDEKRFNKDYQRLNLSGLRADIRLNRLIGSIKENLQDYRLNRKCLMLGFSGGGQFLHRYLAFHGHRVLRSVIGAPGWFMWPNIWLPYPLGLFDSDGMKRPKERLRRLCRQEMLLLVGDRDINQGAFRRTYRTVDLSTLQGRSRRERAINWFSSLKQASINENIEFKGEIQILKNTFHRVNNNLTKTAISFLSGEKNM